MNENKVLVLEADRALRLSRTRVLSQEGYDVTSVSGLEEAARIAGQESYELLVISVDEPELLNMVLSQFPPSIGVLAIVSDGTAGKVAECLESGIHSVLVQPVNTRRLRDAVSKIMKRIRLVRENLRDTVFSDITRINTLLAAETVDDNFYDQIVQIGATGTRADYISLTLKETEAARSSIRSHVGIYRPEWEELYDRLALITEPVLITESSRNHRDIYSEMVRGGISSLLHIPLGTNDDIIGALTHIREDNRDPFGFHDLNFASIVAWWSNIACRNYALRCRNREQCRQTDRLLEELSAAQERERRRVALDIHDGVAQWLVGATYDLRICNKLVEDSNYTELESVLAKATDVIQRSVKELRRAIGNLPLPSLEEDGLVSVLRKATDVLMEQGINCSIEIPGKLPELSLAQKKIVYMIVQESLTNVRRHSQASRVKLTMHYDAHTLSLDISDNGRGFDSVQVLNNAAPLGHMGLLGMRERAELLNGHLDINSEPGRGTSINCSFNLTH